MKLWKRGAALLLCLCMTALLLMGCGQSRSGENTVSVTMTGSVETVDPAYAVSSAARTMVLHLFDNLYRLTEEGAVPAAAQSYQSEDNEDGTQTYTFHLRSDAKWSNGSAVTAQDFVYAWQRLVSPDTDSPNAEILSVVAGYEDAHAGDLDALGVYAEDEHTLVVTLSAPCSYFVESICTAAATMPVPWQVVERSAGWVSGRESFVGNGPYRRIGDWSDGRAATLIKQTDHYDARRTRADRIEILFKSSAETAKSAGSADAAIGAADENGAVGGDPTVGVLLINQMATNMDRSELRQAISLVIDRVAAAGAMGTDYTAAEGLVPYGIRTAEGGVFREVNGAVIDNDTETYGERCSQAASLMQQAGLARPEAIMSLGTVTLLYKNTPLQTALAQRLQDTWREKLGLTVTLQGEDAETYEQMLTGGEFTLALTELSALYNDASAYLDLWRSGDMRNYALIYMNAYDILMRVAAASTSAEARDAYLKDAERLLLDTANVIPIYGKQQPYQLGDDAAGVVSDGLGGWYFGTVRHVTN